MTLPDERTRAVLRMADCALALYRSVSPSLTPCDTVEVRVSAAALTDLLRCLRHYPTAYDLARSAEAAPEIWAMPPGQEGAGTDDPGP